MIILILYSISTISAQDFVSQRIRQNCALTGSTPGSYWDSQQCLPCKSETCFCQNYNFCDSCVEKYYFDTVNRTCQLCPIGCSVCCKQKQLTEILCTNCIDGYLLIGSVCVHLNGCLQPNPQGRCELCQSDGYYLNQQKMCKQCSNGCKTCYNADICSTCLDGFTLRIFDNNITSTQKCYNCNLDNVLKCSICTETYICQKCSPNYFKTENNECIKCQSNCNICEDPRTTNAKCLECEKDYKLFNNGLNCSSCQTTILNCEYCSNLNNQYKCEGCLNEYYLLNNQCLPCNQFTGFLYCDSPIMPTQCQDNYLLVFDSRNQDILSYICIKNDNNCQKIDLKKNCLSCIGDTRLYFDKIDQVYKCVQCGDIVKACEQCVSQNSGISCIVCSKGYYINLDDLTCLECSQNCSECNSTDCKICDFGFYYDSINKQCISCATSNCQTCSKQNDVITCETCSPGFGLDSSGGCWKCEEGCLNCDFNIVTCLQCEDNYYAYLGSCKPFPKYCVQANSRGYCFLCQTVIPDWISMMSANGSNSSSQNETNQTNSSSVDTNSTTDESQINEITFISDPLYASKFYRAVNGYCLLCNNLDSGTFNCPDECQDNVFLQQNMNQNVQFGLLILSILEFLG